MLMPKRVKWRKQMRGRMRGKALRGAEVSFGEFGLQALEPGWITARQIEAGRRSIVRALMGRPWRARVTSSPSKPRSWRANRQGSNYESNEGRGYPQIIGGGNPRKAG